MFRGSYAAHARILLLTVRKKIMCLIFACRWLFRLDPFLYKPLLYWSVAGILFLSIFSAPWSSSVLPAGMLLGMLSISASSSSLSVSSAWFVFATPSPSWTLVPTFFASDSAGGVVPVIGSADLMALSASIPVTEKLGQCKSRQGPQYNQTLYLGFQSRCCCCLYQPKTTPYSLSIRQCFISLGFSAYTWCGFHSRGCKIMSAFRPKGFETVSSKSASYSGLF